MGVGSEHDLQRSAHGCSCVGRFRWVTTKKDLKKGRSKSRWRFGRTKYVGHSPIGSGTEWMGLIRMTRGLMCTRGRSDVVAYADNYAMARGHNPYATSSSVVKKT